MKRCPRGLGLGGLRPLAPAPYVVLDPLFNILFTLPPPPLTYFPPVLSASVFSSIFSSFPPLVCHDETSHDMEEEGSPSYKKKSAERK